MSKWSGSTPTICNLCNHPLAHTFFEGKTTWGNNAVMCPTCFGTFGTGLGEGKCQEYDLQTLQKTRG